MTAKLGIVGIRSCLEARKNNKTIFFPLFVYTKVKSNKLLCKLPVEREARGRKKTIVAIVQCENIQVDARAAAVKNVIASDLKLSLGDLKNSRHV